MIVPSRLRASLGVFVLLLVLAPAAHALRCGNRLVSAGDYDFQVSARCGAPFWIEDHYQLTIVGNDTYEIVQPTEYRAWYFNFGANRLIVRLLFRDGRLVREEALDRGVDELGQACSPARFVDGISSGELVAYCGQPVTRSVQPAVVSTRLAPGVVQQSDSYREDWVYDFGGDLLYLLHLVNGRVMAIEHVPR